MVDVVWHPDVLLHDAGVGVFEAPPSDLLEVQVEHPEGGIRIRNMRSVLLRGPVAPRLAWREGRHATEAELCLFHDPSYVEDLKVAARTSRRFTSTTLMSPGSFAALLASAGTSLAALECVLGGSGRPAFALVRPPGHHAARGVADGYCFVNNVAIVAEAALAAGLRRIAIVDWDVHHGNGTQDGFYTRDDVLTLSLHMDHGAWGPTHPQTGAIDERGRGPGLGANLNIPLPMGSGDVAYLMAFDEIVAPRVRSFGPDLIVIAHGLDAGQFDPNGRNLVTSAGFHALARRARALAVELSSGRLVAVQEGGYNAAHAAFCLHAAIEGFAGLPLSVADPLSYLPAFEDRARVDVDRIKAALAWSPDGTPSASP
jgi:acetoin utilization deacetylase AcuC-like enzyme